MSSYVTTNIRLAEDDYLRLKGEAAQKRKSLAAVIREKISGEKKTHSPAHAKQFIAGVRKLAKENAKYQKGIDAGRMFREMRENAKW